MLSCIMAVAISKMENKFEPPTGGLQMGLLVGDEAFYIEDTSTLTVMSFIFLITLLVSTLLLVPFKFNFRFCRPFAYYLIGRWIK